MIILIDILLNMMDIKEDQNDMTLKLIKEEDEIGTEAHNSINHSFEEQKYIFMPLEGENVYDSHKYESLDI